MFYNAYLSGSPNHTTIDTVLATLQKNNVEVKTCLLEKNNKNARFQNPGSLTIDPTSLKTLSICSILKLKH